MKYQIFIAFRERNLLLMHKPFITKEATAFRQMKRTVVLPTRIVRAWPKQPNFLPDCLRSHRPGSCLGVT
jgi:hypothetical protein